MELRQLRYFVAVAQDENFTRAARRLHVTQPGISQQIRSLEIDLGQQLFDRTHRSIRLTAAGRAFLPHAQAALAATQAGRSALADQAGLVCGSMRLGTIQGVPQIDLASLLTTYYQYCPGVEVTLREEHPDALIKHLKNDDYDAAIIGLSHPNPPDGLSIRLLDVEPLLLVTAPQHPLGDRQHITVEELNDESFVTLPRPSALRRHLEDACNSVGFAPTIALETSDIYLLCRLVARGLGITIVPRSIAAEAAKSQSLSLIEFSPTITRRCTALAWRTTNRQSAATAAFLAIAQTTLLPYSDLQSFGR